MFHFFHSVKNKVLDILLPRACFACGKSDTYFCVSCFIAESSEYKDDLPSWIIALKSYRTPAMRKALWKLKYRGTEALADDLGIHLHEAFLDLITEHELEISGREILLVPIPISKKRYKERGYNQAELLAHALARHATNIQVHAHALVKIKDTLAQAKIKRRKNRLENMHGVFSVTAKQDLKNKAVILIDDIVTTGSTLKDARRAALRGGAALVYALCIAH